MKTRVFILVLSLILSVPLTRAQVWVDTLYQIATANNVVYDTAVNVGGVQQVLRMDISYPVNDTPPPCGRPLLVCVHGGAWMGGTKDDNNVKQWRVDFAKRGYVTASINYRLGILQNPTWHHCNSQIPWLGINFEWDCLQQADTAEWYRALYRAMQDTKSAIRFLVNRQGIYDIDPNNVFLVGESAGGFTVLQTAFMDTATEKPGNTQLMGSVTPNVQYDCPQTSGWGFTYGGSFTRPNLGDINGAGNLPSSPYVLRGVGSFYGGMMGDLLSTNTYNTPPALYLFHQPNDLVVPSGYQRILNGFSDCAYGYCGQGIYNRPWQRGSEAIVELIDSLDLLGYNIPAYTTAFTNNSADCAGQIFNSSLIGHQIDNYQLRTQQMAQLFASRMDTNACFLSPESIVPANNLMIYPNPAEHSLQITATDGMKILQVDVINLLGETIHTQQVNGLGQTQLIRPANLSPGIYPLVISTTQGRIVKKVIWQ